MLSSSSFYLSLLAICFAVALSIFFFVLWVRHGRRSKFLILCATGLFLLYWFHVPIILGNAGERFTLSTFNPFFLAVFPSLFLGLVLIYRSIVSLLPYAHQEKIDRLLVLWVLAAAAIFAFYFGPEGGKLSDYTLHLVSMLFFFLPINVLIFSALLRLFLSRKRPRTKLVDTGLGIALAWPISGIIQALIVIPRLLAYPPQLWYAALVSFNILFFLQALSKILLFTGFLFAYRGWPKDWEG